MAFNSYSFLIFFPAVAALYFLLPHRYRWALLLAASYYFYMCWKPEFAILLLVSTVVDYCVGLMMGRTDIPAKRRKYLIISLFVNLGLLAFFKYGNFAVRQLGIEFNLGIPEAVVGISFYTFQTLSYSIDVYRGKQKPERHLGRFALYVSFFPQLVAGPIERSTHLLPQFARKLKFEWPRISNGLKLMAWGFFKKIVIADRLAVLVDTVYNNPGSFQGMHYVVATVFFAYQIYCDFSGYSDIAIGASMVLGFDLMDNFNRPYAARTIGDFWKRWHISLSSWFRDYLYIPLGGNRVRIPRWCFNIVIVFLLSGFWHGANWTFLCWGALHAVYFLCAHFTVPLRRKLHRIIAVGKVPLLHKTLQIVMIFSLVCFAWIFFRANDIHDAFHIITNINTGWSAIGSAETIRAAIEKMGMDVLMFGVVLVSILFLEIFHYIEKHNKMRAMLAGSSPWMRWPIYVAAAALTVFKLGDTHVSPFIYFAF